MSKIRIAVAGAGGRMGKRILTLASADPDLQIVGALERKDSEILGQTLMGVRVTSDFNEALASAQVLIDFTDPSATECHLKAALQAKAGLVVGTTGLPEEIRSSLKRASSQIPILQSPNMSAGANFLFELVTRAARVLKENYDIEITETHHRMKKDAPSGTAMELARLIAEVKGWDPKKAFLYGRHGETGERKKDTLAIHALRGGDGVGEHTVAFLGDGETIELIHRATSRDAFARGALLAAKFIAPKKNGFYNMQDVLKS